MTDWENDNINLWSCFYETILTSDRQQGLHKIRGFPCWKKTWPLTAPNLQLVPPETHLPKIPLVWRRTGNKNPTCLKMCFQLNGSPLSIGAGGHHRAAGVPPPQPWNRAGGGQASHLLGDRDRLRPGWAGTSAHGLGLAQRACGWERHNCVELDSSWTRDLGPW